MPALAGTTPTFLVPHGAGHGKSMAAGGVAGSGLAGEQLLHEGSVVLAAIGLAHPADALRLARQCPPAAAFARIVGDPCWDRLAASRHRRAAYREAFGLGRARLVVLSSTWGPASLFARHHDLPARLTAELPWDDFRVALVLHPAVWGRHGRDNIERWLRPALDRGLLLLDPDEEWRAALVAADAVIGDHGSVALYAAAAGVPVAMAAFGWAEVDPESAIAALGRTRPRFDVGRPLEEQVARLVEDGVGFGARGANPDGGVADLADRVFAHQGESLARISEVVYELLDLPAPARRLEPLAVPIPRRPAPALDAWWFCHAQVGDGGITVTRRPVSDLEPAPGSRLLADVHAANPRHPAAHRHRAARHIAEL